ncbi:gamma-glutamyltransferase [Sagittula stellata]|nr:gamma-glutamyltransferase [Sagittula stellata]
MRDFHFPGRSAALACNAMVATSHPLATEAALHVLRDGGSAMDAGIAGSAVMAVVEPQMTGIGGDCFALVSAANDAGRVTAFNGSGRSASAASAEQLRAEGLTEVPVDSIHSVTLPGAIDGWFKLHARYGRLDMERLLRPAIALARDGYPVHARVAWDWRQSEQLLASREASRAVFMPGGACPAVGDVHRQEALAQTLERVAKQGPAAFYTGEIAAAMLRTLRANGGVHCEDDFAAVSGDFVDPISTEYRGRRVHQVPPNNQGMTALVMLNLLSGFDLSAMPMMSADRMHLEIEVARLAFAVRNRHITDPHALQARPEDLLSEAYTSELRSRINMERAMRDPGPVEVRKSDTVYMTVVDKDMNAVSFINSIFHGFGSGLLCPETGVLFQNRGHSFSLDPDHPNVLAPSKRPMHTIMPGMVTEDGKPVLSFGVMGGDYQPIGQARVVSALYDHGMELQAALDLPRLFTLASGVDIERSLPPEVMYGLMEKGHALQVVDEPIGGAQAIAIDHARGVLIGASDPRKDGYAAGF